MSAPGLSIPVRRILPFVALFAILGIVGGPGTAQAAPTTPPRNIVVLGIGGLQWSDISPTKTPTLYGLVSESATASLTVRTQDEVTCPSDGWLTTGAGRRSVIGGRNEGVSICQPTPEPETVETSPGKSRTIVDLDPISAANVKPGYSPTFGEFGDALASAEISSMAVGPGASLALVTTSGRVVNYRSSASDVKPQDFERHQLIMVDLGNIAEPGFLPGIPLPVLDDDDHTNGDDSLAPEDISIEEDLPTIPEPSPEQSAAVRPEQVALIEEQAKNLLSMVPEDSSVMLMGPSGSQRTAHLTVLSLREPGAEGSWLNTMSTRRDAIVQLTDIGPTLRDRLGIPPSTDAVGTAAHPGGDPKEDAWERAQLLARTDGQANIVRTVMAPFFVGAIAIMVIVITLSFVLIRYRPNKELTLDRIATIERRSRLGNRILRWAMPSFAFIPLATFLGGALPWWTTTRPTPWFMLSIVACWLVLSLIVFIVPWRQYFLGPTATVTLLTSMILIADTLTGSRLQWMSMLGDTPLVAGRFYGISNSPLALALTGILVGLAAISGPITKKCGKLTTIFMVIAVGVGFVWTVGVPGANFGGPIASVPGFAILALLLSGLVVTWRKTLVTVAMGVGVISIFAVIDSFRAEASQTHLGRFIGQLANGEGWTIAGRKLEANLTIVGGSWGLTVAMIALVGAGAWVLLDPQRIGLSGLASAYRRAPTLKAGMGAVLMALTIAICVKDSGIAMPLVAALMLGPLLFSVSARAHDLDQQSLAVDTPELVQTPEPVNAEGESSQKAAPDSTGTTKDA